MGRKEGRWKELKENWIKKREKEGPPLAIIKLYRVYSKTIKLGIWTLQC